MYNDEQKFLIPAVKALETLNSCCTNPPHTNHQDRRYGQTFDRLSLAHRGAIAKRRAVQKH